LHVVAKALTASPRQSTRERILDVAMELFVERGVAGTSISEIERRAGLASGTGSLYRHFRSKEDVLYAAVEREAVRLLSEVDAGRAASETTNVASSHESVVAKLRATMLDRLIETTDVIPLRRDPRMEPALIEQFTNSA
jgi:AcrR family transcriptional regulator